MAGHPLPEAAVLRLSSHGIAEGDLRAMLVVTGAPGRWLPPLLRAGAVTLGRSVYFREGRYDAESARGLALIAHEAGHIDQWRELGVVRFLLRYARGLVRSRFKHADHPMERPLNELQRELRAALEAESPDA